MKYHDYHLRGYSVESFGSRIVLDLVYDYPGADKQESKIEFSDVACYFFQHTAGAIITNIEKFDITTIVREEENLLVSFAEQYGLKYWNKSISDYADTL